MKHLKSFKRFYKDATCSVSNTSGMGAVVSSQPGALPGDTKRRRKRFSDLRDLKPVKINKIED